MYPTLRAGNLSVRSTEQNVDGELKMIIGKLVEVAYNKEIYTGILVHFGIGYEELRDGIGHYTEALVMREDGEIKTCPVTCMKVLFNTKEK